MTNEPNAPVQALLVEGTPEAAARLRDLAETTPEKDTRKAARRALYLLSQKGILPAVTQATVQPAFHPGTGRDGLRAWASAYDGAGNRLLFLTWPDPDGGSPTFLQTLVSDEEGVRDMDTRRIGRGELAQRLEGFAAQLEAGIALAEIEPDYGRFLLHQARTVNQQRRSRTPAGFLDVLKVIGEPTQEYTHSPVWDVLTPDAIRNDADIDRDPAALFALPWFDAWFLDVNDVVFWLGVIYDVRGQSDLPEDVQKQKLNDTAREAADTLLTGELSARYTRRLEESADILRRRSRDAQARQALVHALSLKTASSAADSPFAVLLVQRTMQAAVEMMRNQAKPVA
jgi:hypothetical protein